MGNRFALGYLLAEQGAVCVGVNKICCTDINNSGQLEMDLKKIYEQASWVHRCHQGQMLVLSGPPLKASCLALPSYCSSWAQ